MLRIAIRFFATVLIASSASASLAAGLSVRSPAFSDGAPLPARFEHAPQGNDLSPPLSWTGAPAGTASFAIVAEDLNAPGGKPFGHWVLYDIPSTVDALPEASAGSGTLGLNDYGKQGWGGPMPPPGSGTH